LAQLLDAPHAPSGGFGVDQLCGSFQQICRLVVEMPDAFRGSERARSLVSAIWVGAETKTWPLPGWPAVFQAS
jgi:hypothetical protein